MDLRGRTAFVTGAGGFIGRALALRLATAEGMRVRALVRQDGASRHSNVESIGVEMVAGDVLDPPSLRSLMRGVDVVIHAAAARPGSSRSTTRATIVHGTRNVFTAGADAGAARFIHLSTFDVYFGNPEGRPTEDSALHTSGDVYGDAKITAEEWLRGQGVPGPRVVVLRPPFVYGPGSRDGVGRYVDGLRRNRMFLPGGGHFPFPYLYVENLIDAIVAAAQCADAGPVYNVLDGRLPFAEFLAPLARVAGRRARAAPFWAVALAARGADLHARLTGRWHPFNAVAVRMMKRSSSPLATADKARHELGWTPRVEFAEGMRRTCEWLITNAHADTA